MRKTSMWITRTVAIAATTMVALSLAVSAGNRLLDQEAQSREAYLSALADDTALKEIIRFSYDINSHSYSFGSMIGDAQRLAEDAGRERIVKVIGAMIRENLSVIQENANNPNSHVYVGARHDINHLIVMLEGLPGDDTLAILKECLLSESEGTRADARRTALALGADLDATNTIQTATLEPAQPPETAGTNTSPPQSRIEGNIAASPAPVKRGLANNQGGAVCAVILAASLAFAAFWLTRRKQ